MSSSSGKTNHYIKKLPKVRGQLIENSELAPLTWFRVGGPADIIFLPQDESDLINFIKAIPKTIPVTAIGVGSNLLVRDGGIPGIVIRFANDFNKIEALSDSKVKVGAGVLDANIAKFAANQGIAGLEFLRGIPGTLGGALRMNAGAYGTEIKDVFVQATAIDRSGSRHELSYEDMGFDYRKTASPDDFLFTNAILKGIPGNPNEIKNRMEEIMAAREASQPIRERTGGSTFKNPPAEITDLKAWQLVDAAGGRGLTIGDAQFSEKHCNFLINRGKATAADLEELGETIRTRIKEKTGIQLHWEIRRIGNKAP